MPSNPALASATGLPETNRRESDDAYSFVVAVLNPRWRVIRCKDGIQWLLQHRVTGSETATREAWRGVKYHRARDPLLRSVAELKVEADAAALAILQALPERIEECRP